MELAVRAFTTFFATVSPVDVAAIYAALTVTASPAQRRRMAVKGVLVASGILLLFTLFGSDALRWLGISLPALRTAGGVLLLLLAIDMVFARPSGMAQTTSAETVEAESRRDISVFPLATPLIAGPASMGAAVLLIAEAQGDLVKETTVVGALVAVMAVTLGLLLVAGGLHRVLGVTGQTVIARVIGILLAALAVQFVFDGVAASGLLGEAGRSEGPDAVLVVDADLAPAVAVGIGPLVAVDVAEGRVAMDRRRGVGLVLPAVGEARLDSDQGAVLLAGEGNGVVGEGLVGVDDGGKLEGRQLAAAAGEKQDRDGQSRA